MNSSELQERHFTALKKKYAVNHYDSATSEKFLYLILRKTDSGLKITNLELQWLVESRFFEAVEIISLQQYQAEDRNRLEAEFLQLRTKYLIPEELKLDITNPIYSVLGKIDAGCTFTDPDLELLNSQGLVNTTTVIQDILNFSSLKTNYKATKHLNQFPEEPLYSILKKLDLKEPLIDADANWLLDQDFEETLEIHWQQENERKAELEFLELKSRYRVDSHPDTSISSPLYSILIKLNSEEELEHCECKWLKQKNLNEIIAIDRNHKDRKFFAELKTSYKAARYQISDPSSRLFLILKNLEFSELKNSNLSRDLRELVEDIESQISEKDIQWLLGEGLTETVEIAKQIHFRTLKAKYQMVGQLAIAPFYEIMLKLEREERLDSKQVIQLIEEGRLSRHGKIAIAYYRLEAIFYEKEYRRTGNTRNLPSASSNWRKADDPERALKATEKVNWNTIRESDLKSALWVTRGAAFRDLDRLDEAENCATQARECQSDSHQPYTLLGAICYDRGKYPEGDHWFEMAAERGADDTEDQIEKIVRMEKDKEKRRDIAKYLLNKDPIQYRWANSYLK